MSNSVVIIGAGFAGLSAATFMAKAGWKVTIIEKHSGSGGRARLLEENGFKFDMGPSWYWMPDVFERYFMQFGKEVKDYYSLQRLDPSYRVYWEKEYYDIPSNYNKLTMLFNELEPGSGIKLDNYLKEASIKYNIGMQYMVYKPGLSVSEFIDWKIIKNAFKIDLLTSIKTHIAKYFKDYRIRQLLEFPVLFLGALPENTPAIYSLMNYADIVGGTWYPKGGMHSIIKAMQILAEECGVQFEFNQDVHELVIERSSIKKVITKDRTYISDVVISSADYHFTETKLLPKAYRSYSNDYWDKKILAPSCLLYYVGLNKKLDNVLHHSLFFDVPFHQHAREIYSNPSWPVEPLFYLSVSSKTDLNTAPEGCENLMILIPVASGLKNDTEELREYYFKMVIKRLENRTGQNISESIIFKKTFSVSDFSKEYNSFKGNAYGLANTLGQSANLKPSCKSKKVKNLFYAGQLTIPGPGVPPCLISGEVVSKEVIKTFNVKAL